MEKEIPSGEIVPVRLVPNQDRISGYLDGLNAILKRYQIKPSAFLDGAMFLCNPAAIKNNPDWIAQAAHSLREIGYLYSGYPTKRRRGLKTEVLLRFLPLLRKIYISNRITRSKKIKKIIRVYMEETEAVVLSSRINEMTHLFAEIAHHHSQTQGDEKGSLKRLRKFGLAKDYDKEITPEVFIALAKDFLQAISNTISAHLTLHQKIEAFCDELKQGKGDKSRLAHLLAANQDAKRYFYSVAPLESFLWLEQKGFLDTIKQKSKDGSSNLNQAPELHYLTRVIEGGISEKVVNYIVTITVSKETVNADVLDQILWMSSKLPADQLKRIVIKIKKDGWVRLMGAFNRMGFEYKRMFDVLAAAHDYESIVALAESVLSVRSKSDVKKSGFGSIDNPFYFDDLHYCEVFERLNEVEGNEVEMALKIVLHTLGEVVLLSEEKKDEVFPVGDMFDLLDCDFFTLEFSQGNRLSSKDDVRDLVAIAKKLAAKVIGNTENTPALTRSLYTKYFKPLPNARIIWRLQMYLWCHCPNVFLDKMQAAIFKGIESEQTLWPISGGPEYKRLLKTTMALFNNKERRDYIDKAFELFKSLSGKHTYGYEILSSIFEYLSDEDRVRAEEMYNQPLQSDFAFLPSIGESVAGIVQPQIPPNTESEWLKSVTEIAGFLKTKWAPAELRKLDENRDFLRPVNAEGISEKLIADIAIRLPEYLPISESFFDRVHLNSHYTYSYLYGLKEAIRTDRARAGLLDFGPILALGKAIVESGITEDEPIYEREQYGSYLVGWSAVLSILSDVLKEILSDEKGKTIIDFKTHRANILYIIRFLLASSDPRPSDEENTTAKMKTKSSGEDYQAVEPFTLAINSIRGRAFETFIYFIQQDDGQFEKESSSKLCIDVKEIYFNLLKSEKTRALMCLFGRYLAFIFYRDREWTREKILPILFTKETEKADLYLAAWEGYLSSSLYVELFVELFEQYVLAINLDPSGYTKRKYQHDLDEALATHIALAYIHFKEMTIYSDLFQAFWKRDITKRWESFIEFIGRSVISRNEPIEWLKLHPEVDIKKLEAFWDWAIINCRDQKAMAGFGLWMQTKDNIFDPVWLADHIDRTLEISTGRIDWAYGFSESLPILAEASPEKTLSAMRRYLIDGTFSKEAGWYVLDDTTLNIVLRILYNKESTKHETYNLINALLPLGGGRFWGLKDILQ